MAAGPRSRGARAVLGPLGFSARRQGTQGALGDLSAINSGAHRVGFVTCAHRTDTRLLSRSSIPHEITMSHSPSPLPHSFHHARCCSSECACVCPQTTRPMLAKLLTVCLLASTSAFAPPASIANRAVAKPLVTSRGPTIEMMPTWQKQGKLFQIPHQSTGENPDTEVLPPARRTRPWPGQRVQHLTPEHGLRRCSISSTCSASRRS